MTRNSASTMPYCAGSARPAYEVIVTLDDDLQNPPEEIGSS